MPIDVTHPPLLLASVLALCVPFAAAPAWADSVRHSRDIPVLLNDEQAARARATFSAIKAGKWADAQGLIQTLDTRDPLRAVALAELYTAKNSPKVELFELLDLINNAAWLPQREQLSAMAKKRGATMLPALPQTRQLVWHAGAPRRKYVATVKQDQAAQALGAKILPLIKADDSVGAEAVLNATDLLTLSAEGRTEWIARVAWSYYIGNDDANARRVAGLALNGGVGEWAVQAHWTAGLAAWRDRDCRAAANSFAKVAAEASDEDMRAGGYYWAGRSHMVCGEPAKVEKLLQAAARVDESFYGMIAREALGMTAPPSRETGLAASHWAQVKDAPNVRAAIALVEIGEDRLADEALKFQTRLSDGRDHAALVRLAQGLNLPQTQIWLAHNAPRGARPESFARYPAPNWKPDGGWRVDKALVFAHALQESAFSTTAVSTAGAVGLMQVRPGTARDFAVREGRPFDAMTLTQPATNMAYGQRYLEGLRDMSETGGLLPKVMAAYNAGPVPVGRWATEVKDNGDPLLFIESMPYYETRAYVNIVMRNYWMYQLEEGQKPASLASLAQGLWPRFPGMPGAPAVRIGATNVVPVKGESRQLALASGSGDAN